MTTLTPTTSHSHDQPSLPNQPFFSWLRTQTTLFISHIAAVFTFVSFVAATTYYTLNAKKETFETGRFDPQTIKVVVDYAHIVIIVVFIVVLIRYLDDNSAGTYRVGLVLRRVFNDENSPEAHQPQNLASSEPAMTADLPETRLDKSMKQLRKFKRRFLWFWCAMLALYIGFGWDHTYERLTSQAKQPTPQDIHRFASHNPQSTGLSNLAQKTDDGAKDVEQSLEFINSETARLSQGSESENDSDPAETRRIFFAIFEFTFNNISLLMIYWCFLAMFFTPGAAKRLEHQRIRLSLGAILVFTLLFPLLILRIGHSVTVGELKDYSAVFDALSGTINAIVLALLIARLDSKLIGLPSRLIGVLYSYAAVQPLFVAFEQGTNSVLQEITASVLAFVLVSKIYFFLIIMYALQTGRMLNYLVCFPTLRRLARFGRFHRGVQYLGVRFQRETSTNRIMRQVDRFEKYFFVRLSERTRKWVKWKTAHFMSRIKSQRSLMVAEWCGFGSLAMFFAGLIGYLVLRRMDVVDTIASHTLALDRLNSTILYTQLVAVAAMIAVLFLSRFDKGCHLVTVRTASERFFKERLNALGYSPVIAQKQLQKFKEYFLWFWVVTFLLYVVLLLESKYGVQRNAIGEASVGISTAAGILTFPFLKFLLSSVNLLFVFWCFVILQAPAYDVRSRKKQKLFINYSSLIVILLVAAFLLLTAFAVGRGSADEELVGYATVFDGIIGTLSGVALALLIARLDSKLFNLRQPQMYILFAYAAIQPLFVVFELNEQVFRTIEAAVLLGALGLKICFFLTIAHTLQRGKMLNYLVAFPSLSDRVDSIFENQFEIRSSAVGANADRFTLTIWRKNALVYNMTGDRFSSREACDAAIAALHEAVPNLEPRDQPDPVAGTYWVKIPISEGRLIESVPLRSQEERKDLIEESKQYIPYCKYNRS